MSLRSLSNVLGHPLPKLARRGSFSLLLPTRRDITSVSQLAAPTALYESISAAIPRIPGGYFARVLMVGTASATGNNAFDGAMQPAASGETALFEGLLPSSVGSLRLEQWGYNVVPATAAGSSSFLRLSFDGGSTSRTLQVGSAKGTPDNTYGANGCAFSFSGATTGWAPTRVAWGAKRCVDTDIGYSDSTSYGPNSQASYGSASNVPLTFSLAGRAVTAWFNKGSNNQTGAVIDGVQYGFAEQAAYGGFPNSGLRTAVYAGCALLELIPLSRKELAHASRSLPC